jgi:hypothetical protein
LHADDVGNNHSLGKNRFGRNSLVSNNSYVSKNSCGNKISCLAAIETIAGMLGFLCAGCRLEAWQVPARIGAVAASTIPGSAGIAVMALGRG